MLLVRMVFQIFPFCSTIYTKESEKKNTACNRMKTEGVIGCIQTQKVDFQILMVRTDKDL